MNRQLLLQLRFFFLIVILCSSGHFLTAQKLFDQISSSHSGISFSNDIKDTKDHNILLYANYYGGAGVGIGDFNNDGLQDLFFAGNLVPDKLYINLGDFQFKDVTLEAGIIKTQGWTTGVTLADVNNDGHLDIYLSRELYDEQAEWRANLLYINQGNGTFKEAAKEYGVDSNQRTRHATFLDYDKDGFLDLFLLTQPPNPGSYSKFAGSKLLQPEYHLVLLKNTGTGKFIDVSEAAGINKIGFPNGVSASDINNDGWPDLYVANDFYAPDFLFINNKNGTFTNTIDTAVNHMSYYSMGVDIADIDNDGLLDIFVVDMVAEDNFRQKANMSGMNPKAFQKVIDDGGHYQYMYNSLQLNNGNGSFSDVAQFSKMAATDWSWANLIADFDNDGLKDTYITNGLLYDIRNTDADKKVGQFVTETANKWLKENPDGGDITIWDILDLDKALELLPSTPLKNYAFKNKGDLEFENISASWGLDQESFSNGAAYGDLDNDGDLDIVVNNINQEAFVYRNNAESKLSANYLRVQLVDNTNKPIFGARISLYAKSSKQVFETTNVRGIYSTSESVAHFGLKNLTEVDSVVVRWPNQKVSVLKKLAVNQLLTINSTTAKSEHKSAPIATVLFTAAKAPDGIEYAHKENPFDDYEKQILLPHKMSQFGPAMAVGDVNNDGLDDIFYGAAFTYAPSLYIQNSQGEFTQSSQVFWDKEAVYEDVDALFADVNLDGFLDLYVVSGGNEYPKNDVHYSDRLYLNDGHGNFSKGAIINVNRSSGGVVKAEDFDKDGDLDFFVGARHTPHQYPVPAASMILMNNKGQLENVTKAIAPELNTAGMVTDAIWMDYDNDDDMDLIVVGEWMPISIYENQQGTFKKTELSAFSNAEGWWYSIEEGDFDNDGDVDFIAGNMGLNYKYKASPQEPFEIYYDDFDANGSFDIVLGYYNNNKQFPLRGFSCSAQQVPGLKKQIQKYDLFASLELEEVYGKSNLQKALQYQVQTFASVFIENLGKGDFKISNLPNLAQLSSINDILIQDFNSDGNLDALMVGNLFVSEIETPRNDAGTGVLLLGDGKNNFKALKAFESGFFANKDAKKLSRITTSKGEFIIVANNNDSPQYFNLNK